MINRLGDILRRMLGKPDSRNLPLWNAQEQSSQFAVPNAIPWLLKSRGDDFHEIAHLLAGLMRKTRPFEWTRLYAEFGSPWIEPADVRRLARLAPDDAVEMLGVATLSANGYTREAALHALASLGHTRAVPYALLRLGDWVAKVRDAALQTLYALLSTGITSELLEHHYLIERLSDVQRVDLSRIISELRECLQTPESCGVIEEALNSDRTPKRLFAFRLLEDELDERLIAQAVSDSAPSIRLWLARIVLRSESPTSHDLFVRLLRDKSSRVSTTMIRTLVPTQITRFRDELVELAFSGARLVREAARYVLEVACEIDLAAESRRRLAQSPPASVQPGVVASLGETGEGGDFTLVEPLLNSQCPRIREAAVAASARLGGEPAIDLVIPFLNDPSGRVRRAAGKTLSYSRLQRTSLQAVHRVLEKGSESGQAQALRVLATRSGWDAVPGILHGLCSEYESVRHRAWQNVQAWQKQYGTKGWLKPSHEVLADLALHWQRVQPTQLGAPDWAEANWRQMRTWIGEVLAESGLEAAP